jgi:hypothetical protein
MALRVARGLFRVWLVLSVLWIGGVGVVTWRTFPADEWGQFPKLPPGFVIDPKPNDFNPDQYLASKLAEERRSAIWHASLLAFLPPAFVLALGSALVWAIRGFR